MAWFNKFGFGAQSSSATDSGNASYDARDELLGAFKDLSYEECRDIYRYWALGKRMATSLPQFAMSAGRTLRCGFDIPEANQALADVSREIECEQVAFQAAVYARIYGISFIYASGEIEPELPIDFEYMQSGKPFKFNVLDPLANGGSVQIDLDPLSPTFQKPLGTFIQGRAAHSNRVKVCQNDLPLYLKFTPSNHSFASPSIYQNMTLLIRSWNRAIISLQRMATKGSALVLKSKDGGNLTNALNKAAMGLNLELLRSMENDGIGQIKVGEDVSFFGLQGVQEIDIIIQKIQNALMMALGDTPSGILLDQYLSSGFSDGDNDMKTIVIAVERFRNNVLTPIYNFIDKFICYRAYTPELLNYIKNNYDYFAKMSELEIFEELMSSFNFEYGEVYPQTDNERADTIGKRLDSVIKLKELGVEVNQLEASINAIDAFGSEIKYNIDAERLFMQDFYTSGGEENQLDYDREAYKKNSEVAKGIDTRDSENNHGQSKARSR